MLLSELLVSNFQRCWTLECELLVTGWVACNRLPVLVKSPTSGRRNPTGSRSWFFPWLGTRFPHKILCIHYFLHICLPLCPDQVARSIRLPDLWKFGKNTIHPPLVSCTLKLTHTHTKRQFKCTEITRVYS